VSGALRRRQPVEHARDLARIIGGGEVFSFAGGRQSPARNRAAQNLSMFEIFKD
jgi:hypothetical protein